MADVPSPAESPGPNVKSDGSGNRAGPPGYSRRKPGHRERTDAYPGLRQFAAQQLVPRIEALTKEIDGVRAGEDIEYLHRMRVASRRLRAALPIFASCFPSKKYARWLFDIRRITRVLGDARDADVQIAALRKYRKRIQKKQETDPAEKKSRDDALMEGIGYLLSKTRDRRAEYQKEIVSALSDLEKHHVIEEIRQAVLTAAVSPGNPGKKFPMAGVPPTGISYMGNGIDKLLSYHQWVKYPDAVAEHHAMRIAAKHLRYMMELYSPLYRRGLKKPISQVTRLQEVLGELHDCDVWIDRVTLLLLKERTKPRVLRDTNRPGPVVISGLKLFLNDRERERKSIYRRFSHFWESLNRTGAWQTLRTTLVTGVKIPYTAPGNLPDEVTDAAVRDLARVFPAGISHANHVARLAEGLFDSLQQVHGLDGRDRLLLGWAAMLHDIGCKAGQKGHPERSAAMILSDDYIPWNIPERGIVALAAAAHRGKVSIQSEGIFGVLSQPDQHRALLVASLLRIADGLDVRHNGVVTSVTCRIDGKQVVCTITSDGDAGPEQQKAWAKSDLFAHVSGYTIIFG
ncbi:MAG TPA: CHAD domain-containing protein [Methanoregulaceae archaeon]|nr:CHAD domain-containing protein [Methanoregulaceae archaeon]